DVDLVVVLELLLLARRHDGKRHGDGVFLHQPLELHQRHELAVDADDGVRSDLDVEVRSSPFRGNFQKVVDVHWGSLGNRYFTVKTYKAPPRWAPGMYPACRRDRLTMSRSRWWSSCTAAAPTPTIWPTWPR